MSSKIFLKFLYCYYANLLILQIVNKEQKFRSLINRYAMSRVGVFVSKISVDRKQVFSCILYDLCHYAAQGFEFEL